MAHHDTANAATEMLLLPFRLFEQSDPTPVGRFDDILSTAFVWGVVATVLALPLILIGIGFVAGRMTS